MEEQNTSRKGGVGFVSLLGLLFITLKLCNVIDWSWWWVLAPFWGGLSIIVIILAVLLVSLLIIDRMESAKAKKFREELDDFKLKHSKNNKGL